MPEKICEHCGVYEFLSDNRRVVASIRDQTIVLIDVVTDQVTTVFADDGTGIIERPSVSPDDRWLAYRRTTGSKAKTFVAPLVTGTRRGVQVDEPTTTGRPCGWSPDSRILYLFLDADGSRCLWGQRIDPATGQQVGPYVVRHLHDMTNSLGGVGTSLGNAITAQGLLYEAMSTRSSLWRLQIPQ